MCIRDSLCTGGDTLLALMRTVGVAELTPVRELATGAVLTNFVYQGKTYHIISKSGGFGEPALFCGLAALVGAGNQRLSLIHIFARQYNCLRPGSHGGWSDYTKETLSELESVGMLTLIECAMNGGYDSSKGVFGTYNVPFLDGAMRRHLEASMGTLSLDRDSMGLVRKAQMLYHRDGKETVSYTHLDSIQQFLVAHASPPPFRGRPLGFAFRVTPQYG